MPASTIGPDPLVGAIVEGAVDAGPVLLPRPAALVRLARVPDALRRRVEFRQRPGDDLDEREALLDAVVQERPELVWPRESSGQAIPPGITDPQERGAVGVLQVPRTVSHAQSAVLEQRVVARVRDGLDLATEPVQLRSARRGGPVPGTCRRCREARHDRAIPCPERRHDELLASLAEADVDFRVVQGGIGTDGEVDGYAHLGARSVGHGISLVIA